MFPSVRSAASGSFDRSLWSDANGLTCNDPSRAIQSQKEEADINTIVRNFGVTGKLPVSVRLPTFDDFDQVSDYREAIHAVRDAEKAFLSMPSELRDRLGNSPQRFLEWCADAGNLEEMRKLGLAKPVAPVETPPA